MKFINKDITMVSLSVLLLFSACQQKRKTQQPLPESAHQVELDFAKEFSITKEAEGTLLSIHRKGEEQLDDVFFLSSQASEKYKDIPHIKVPCQRIICLSSTQLSYFFALDDIDHIVGINSSRYLRHEGMNQRLAAGKVKKIGKEGHFNIEMIAALNPDVIFVSPFKVGGYDALRHLGIPLVPMSAYNEETPLGRAEWVKMMALFIGQEAQADTLFAGIAERYTSLKQKTAQVTRRPTVFSGKMRSGTWYVPGGNSFYAHYFRDAGADYIVKDSVQGAYPVDFESIYSRASQCDFWRIIHPEKSGFTLADLKQQDERYADFKAFKDKNVILCNIREKPYYEQAGMKPDVLLADYIHFFHPEILPDYSPVFYSRLK